MPGAAGLWQKSGYKWLGRVSNAPAPGCSWLRVPGGHRALRRGAGRSGARRGCGGTGQEGTEEPGPSPGQAAGGSPASAALPGGGFSAESESQTWHWAAGPSALFPGFHFHFQRVGSPRPSRRTPRQAGCLQRVSPSPPSAVAPFNFAFPLAHEGLRAAPRARTLTLQCCASPTKRRRVLPSKTPVRPACSLHPKHTHDAPGVC